MDIRKVSNDKKEYIDLLLLADEQESMIDKYLKFQFVQRSVIAEQLKSLTTQVSALTRLTAVNPKWLLVDVYIDIASGKTGSSRKEFSRMLQD